MPDRSNFSLPVCRICHGYARVVDVSYPGYRSPTTYQIAQCDACELSFAVPLKSDESLYELIYAQSAEIPGYERYDRYARSVKKQSSALNFLASREESYWAVREAALGLPKNARILDVGTGLGYLAYALVQAGHDAVGLDLSREAVDLAEKRFGDHYVAHDFFDWSEKYKGTYDLVVMLELIEHVEDPDLWLRAALRLLKPGGSVLISTPDRSFYQNGTIWETEAPPVHLWWFSHRSISRLAANVGAQAEAVDLSVCPVVPRRAPAEPVRTLRSPILDASGRPKSKMRTLLRRIGALELAMRLYEQRDRAERLRNVGNPRRRETLVAQITSNT